MTCISTKDTLAESSFVPMSESRIRWVGTATAVIVVALYFGTGVFDHGIWSPSEPAFAGVVWNMFRGGSFAVPRIDYFYYLEKPPLSSLCLRNNLSGDSQRFVTTMAVMPSFDALKKALP